MDQTKPVRIKFFDLKPAELSELQRLDDYSRYQRREAVKPPRLRASVCGGLSGDEDLRKRRAGRQGGADCSGLVPASMNFKNIVLIDFESVQPEALHGMDLPHWHLMLFVGANQLKVPLALAMAMQRMGDRAQYVQISGQGPNALDFHIAFYLGQLAAASPDAVFHVVSKDKGFDPLIQHLKSRQIAVVRSASLPNRTTYDATCRTSADTEHQSSAWCAGECSRGSA